MDLRPAAARLCRSSAAVKAAISTSALTVSAAPPFFSNAIMLPSHWQEPHVHHSSGAAEPTPAAKQIRAWIMRQRGVREVIALEVRNARPLPATTAERQAARHCASREMGSRKGSKTLCLKSALSTAGDVGVAGWFRLACVRVCVCLCVCLCVHGDGKCPLLHCARRAPAAARVGAVGCRGG